MKQIIKKMMLATLVLTIIISAALDVKAAESSDYLFNLSTVPPVISGGISLYGTSRPSEDTYVDLNKEELKFSGNADVTVLYTNKCFTGKTEIGFTITNNSSSRLTVKFYDTGNWLGLSCDDIIVEANSTITGTRSGFKADHFYYMSFSVPNHCEGSVY